MPLPPLVLGSPRRRLLWARLEAGRLRLRSRSGRGSRPAPPAGGASPRDAARWGWGAPRPRDSHRTSRNVGYSRYSGTFESERPPHVGASADGMRSKRSRTGSGVKSRLAARLAGAPARPAGAVLSPVAMPLPSLVLGFAARSAVTLFSRDARPARDGGKPRQGASGGGMGRAELATKASAICEGGADARSPVDVGNDRRVRSTRSLCW
jgi:hypothetical protein